MNCENIERFCRPYLGSLHGENWCFSLYTSHDASHSQAVWENAKKIASGKLSDEEMSFLKAACNCHDLGMTKFDDVDIINEPEYCEHIRKNHHIRSKTFIDKFKDEMEINFKEAEILGEICYCHSSKVDLNDINFDIDGIRTRLLGAILRISDALDASSDRIPSGYQFSEAPHESKIEYLKHMIVSEVTINDKNIILKLFKEPKEHSDAVKTKLISEFKSVKELLKSLDLVSEIEFVYTESKLDESTLKFIPAPVKRIMKLYIKPSNYNEILEKLEYHNIVIISGDANVGKTSTAHYIAGYRWETYENPILLYRPRTQISSLPKNHTIIIDDAFGEKELDDNVFLGYNEIMQLKEDNWVILTSRKQVLDTALYKFRITEADYEKWKVEIGQEGSYTDEDLKAILLNHLKYYYEEEKISSHEIDIAQNNISKIIKSLRFPHNIDILVKEKLNEISEGKSLTDAINEAKYIKRVAKHWFITLEDTRKFFVFIVWMFPTRIELLKEIYPRIINSIKPLRPNLEIEDLNELVFNTSSYIVHDTEYSLNEDKIYIKHANYIEGIEEVIESSFETYIGVLTSSFKDLYREKGFFIIESLNDALLKIARINYEWVLKLIKNILENSDSRIKTRISQAIGKLIYVNENAFIVLLKDFVSDEDWKVRECVPSALIINLPDGLVNYKTFIDESFEILETLVVDRDWGVRANVALSLGKFGLVEPKKSIQMLKELAKDDEWGIKVNVANALGEFGFTELNDSIQILDELSKDEEEDVKKEVLNALTYTVEESLNNGSIKFGFLKYDVSFKLIEKLAYDDNPNVMDHAIRTMILCTIDEIDRVISRSSEIIDILKRLSSEEDCKQVITDSLNDYSHLMDEDVLLEMKTLLNDSELIFEW